MKKIAAIMLAGLTALTMAACNGGKGNNTSSDTPINVNLDKNVSAELRFSITVDGAEKKIAETFAKKFNETYPNIKIKIEQIAGDYRTEILSQVAANRVPDIMWVPDNWVSIFAEKKVLKNLDPYIEASKVNLDDFYPSMLKLGQKDQKGSQYLMPRDYNHVSVFYNKDLFTESGVEFPKDGWTWDEYIATAKKLVKYADGKIDQYATNAMLNWPPVYNAIIQGFGGKLMDENGNPVMNSKETKKALEEMNKMVKEGITHNPFNAPPMEPFLAETSAMWFTVRPSMSNCNDAAINFDIATFPTLPNPSVGCGTSGYGISARTKYPNEAWEFLSFLVSSEGQKAFSTTGNAVPVLKSLAEDQTWRQFPLPNFNHDAFIKFPENDITTDYLVKISAEAQGDVDGKILDMLSSIFSSKKTVEQASNDCVEAINKILESE